MVRLFHFAFENLRNSVESAIQERIYSVTNSDLLNEDRDVWKNKILSEYQYDPIILSRGGSFLLKKPQQNLDDVYDEEDRTYDGYISIITFICVGSINFLKYKPSEYLVKHICLLHPADIAVGKIHVKIYLQNLNENDYLFQEKVATNYLEVNIANLNSEISGLNNSVPQIFDRYFDERRSSASSEESFFTKMSIGINRDVDFQPTQPIKIKVAPAAKSPARRGVDKSQSVVSDIFYFDILDVIDRFYKSVEKKPSIYRDKGEEALRDYILPTLELRYESTSVTSETFNKRGSTDILLKDLDGTVVFVAECKVWSGKSGLLKALDQLFGYMTIRETKAALIIFVKDQVDFYSIVSKVEATISGHPNNRGLNRRINDTTVVYTFHLPTDKNALITLTTACFCFEKIET